MTSQQGLTLQYSPFQSPAQLQKAQAMQAQISRMRFTDGKPTDKNLFTVVLGGRRLKVISGHVSWAIDEMASGWAAEIAWVPVPLPGSDKDIEASLAPYAYPYAQVFLGANLVNTGYLYTVINSFSLEGLTKSLEGASFTADLVDSDLQGPKQIGQPGLFEWENVSAWELISLLCSQLPVPILAVTDMNEMNLPLASGGQVRNNSRFPYIQAEPTEKYAQLFARLAFQRGMLVTTDQYGDLYLTAVNRNQTPVATLGEGDINSWLKMMSTSPSLGNAHSMKWEAKFNGRERFSRYTVYAVPGDGAPTSDVAFDTGIPNNRMNAIVAVDTGIGGLGITAAWKRSRTIADSLTMPFPVTSWYTPKGALWTPGTLVNVQAPSIHIKKAFTFLIRKVEYLFEARGATAVLSLLPPQAYTGEEIPDIFS